MDGVSQTVQDHGADENEIAHLLARPQLLGVRCLAHAFLSAGDDDLRIAFADLLISQRHGAQTRSAQLIQTPDGGFDRQAGSDRSLTRGPLPRPSLQDLTQDPGPL